MKTTVQYAGFGARRRRRRWIILGCCGTVALGLCWHEREPRYQGRSLSNWLDTYDAILSGHLTKPGFLETRAALRHFGQGSLRFYTARLAYEPGWQSTMLGRVDKTPKGVKGLIQPVSEYWHKRIEVRTRRAQTAVLAFQLLGEDAAGAIPDLERLAKSTIYAGRTQRALDALRYLAPRGAEALGRVAVTGDPGVRAAALRRINEMGEDAAPALPLLVKTFGTNFSSDPAGLYEQLIARMQESARYSNGPARVRAMELLAVQSPGVLYNLVYDTNPAVRADVTNVLRKAGIGAWFWDPPSALMPRRDWVFRVFTN